jgi:hypothetical protein
MKSEGRRPGLLVIAAVAVVAGLIGGGVAYAGGTFNDVPSGSQFEADIEAIAAAGITTGFPDGGFHPAANVTRQSMAAFMHRGFGRVDFGTGSDGSAADNVENNVGEVTITAGAVGSGGGYVVLQGSVSGSFVASDCPCSVRSELLDVTANSDDGAHNQSIGNTPTLITAAFAAVDSQFVYSIPAGQTRTYRLNGSAFTTGASTGSIAGSITATYVPFDGSGNA